jgi:hypothetical protein
MRVRIASFAAVVSLLSLGVIAVPAAQASNGTTAPPKAWALKTVPVSGLATKNNKKFTGTFGIQRFVVRHHKVYALGTLKGTFKGRHVTRYNVLMPASLTGSNGMARDAQAGCPVLHLVLGPINLNLLGLQVTLGGGAQANQPIVLDITAQPGPGNLLGNLLCDLTNALNQGGVLSQLNNNLQQLAATLNSLTSILGALGL